MIDFKSYIEKITNANKLAMKHSFLACSCTGIGGVEGILGGYKRRANFVCTSDTCEGRTIQTGGSWQQRRVYTTFIIARYRADDVQDRDAKMNICRQLFTQLKSRMIHDSNIEPYEKGYDAELQNLRTEDIKYKEMGDFLPGSTGLYFIVSEDLPEDLCYRPEEWLEKQS